MLFTEAQLGLMTMWVQAGSGGVGQCMQEQQWDVMGWIAGACVCMLFTCVHVWDYVCMVTYVHVYVYVCMYVWHGA